MTARLSAASACHHRLGFFGRFRHDLVGLRDADNFFDGRSALRDPAPAVLPKCLHSFGNGALFEFAAVTLLHDQFSERLGHDANLINRGAALVSSVTTTVTSAPALRRNSTRR